MSWSRPRAVVVPVDFSDQAMEAVRQAREHAVGGVVHVVHVLLPLPVGTPGAFFGSVDDAGRKGHVITALEEAFPDRHGLAFHALVDDPGRAITTLAEEVSAELIVMPSHGRTGLSRLLLGSVAERVVRLAHCPVLVLRRPG